MNKRYKDLYEKIIYKGQKTPFSLGTLAVVSLSVLTIIVATFIQLEIIHPWFIKNTTGDIEIFMKSYSYIPQIPAIFLILSILGKKYTFLTIILYTIIGLHFWPIFAMGGGVGYIKTGFFGYILGYIPAIIIAGNLLKSKHIKHTSLAAISGILTIDTIGFIYTLILVIFRLVDSSNIQFALSNFAPNHIIYDFLCSLIALYTGFALKYLVWPAMYTNIRSKKIENMKQTMKQTIKKTIEIKKEEPDEFDIGLSKKQPKKKTVKKKQEPKTKSVKETPKTKTKTTRKRKPKNS